MNRLNYLIIFLIFVACNSENKTNNGIRMDTQLTKAEYAIILHGGAGYTSNNISQEEKDKFYKMLEQALSIGEDILKSGGTSMDAVESTIAFMENDSFYNAGKGAVFAHNGINELDASFMDGKSLNAGAVGGVTNVKNPIKGARAVMEKSNHVLLTQRGAEVFCEEQGLEIVDPKYFYKVSSWGNLQNAIRNEKKKQGFYNNGEPNDSKFGTVGCAALDKNGNLAAGTSTGGMTNKKWNRIGDSPIIGAGTYADNATCAVSCTGHGEFFIRYAVAHDLSARIKYGKLPISEAADQIIMKDLKEAGGAGGLIAVDKYGNFAHPFNTESMFRAYAKPGERKVAIW